MADRTILLFGSSATGKSTQIGELAEKVYKEQGKRTRLYTADPGGSESLNAHVKLGIIQRVNLVGSNPWMLEWAADGLMPPPTPGKWISDPSDDEIGLYAYEGITSFGVAMMQDLSKQAAQGTNIGGGLAIKVESEVDGERIVIGSNNMAHYGIVQTRITDLVWRSFRRNGTVLWTALDRKGVDPETGNAVVGPEAPGKALVSTIPSWFNLVFHLTVKAGPSGKEPIHELYMVPHQDMSTGGVQTALANARLPRGSQLKELVIKPSSLTKALEILENQTSIEEERLRKELKLND